MKPLLKTEVSFGVFLLKKINKAVEESGEAYTLFLVDTMYGNILLY